MPCSSITRSTCSKSVMSPRTSVIALERVWPHDELEPGGIVADVETDDRRPLVGEHVARPRAEAARAPL